MYSTQVVQFVVASGSTLMIMTVLVIYSDELSPFKLGDNEHLIVARMIHNSDAYSFIMLYNISLVSI